MQKIAAAIVTAARKARTPEGRVELGAALRAQRVAEKRKPPVGRKTDALTRFNRHLAFSSCDCWFWVGSRDNGGYGVLPGAMNETKAHRVSYRLFVGEIPAGMKVLHSCDTPCCVNPAHLRTGSQSENVADMCAKGRQRAIPLCGSRNPMAKATPEIVAAIRGEFERGTTQRQIARDFSLSLMTINRIVRKESWK